MMRNKAKNTNIQSAERGQSFVELALFLTLLLIILAGVVDLGRAFYTYLTLRDASQEGASYASVCPTDISGMEARARGSSSEPIDLTDTGLVSFGCNFVHTNGSVTACSGSIAKGEGVRITISTPNFPLVMPFLGLFVGSQTVAISASSTALVLTTSCP